MTRAIPAAAKLLDRDEILRRYGRPRELRVAFTNGCFDLLHRGHVEYLQAARNSADALIVGLNSDASVRRLKGSDRPLVPQRDRAIVLASLAAVDAVTVFDEDTPRELLEVLLPDLLVKGGDYTIDRVIGRQEVENAGGEVLILPFREGHSTSGLLQRLREL